LQNFSSFSRVRILILMKKGLSRYLKGRKNKRKNELVLQMFGDMIYWRVFLA